MRILSLRFRNLNSLAGEWKIDFTNPEYVSSGIFAITGPTGAGKSTILDAICLALYGRTPRLGKIAGNAGEILSRQTGEYFAEVEFHSEKGQYRCTWSQRRAHKKPDGELQSPRHEIVEVKTGKALETKQGAVQQKVIELTGLDYLQFTRSILLAQGEFATFLDAKAEDRAPILEKITGTEIYGQISIKVHERFSREKADLAVLNDRAENTEMISAEQAEELRKEKLDHEQVIKDISTRCTTLETAVKWLDTLAELEKEIADLRRRDLALADRKKAAGPDLDVLSLARKARSLEGIFAGLSALRGEQERDTAEKTSCEAQLAELNAAYEQVLETFRTAREKREATLQEKEREEGIIRTVRELDSKIRETTKNRDDRTEERRTIVETIRTYQNSLRGIESALTANRQELSVAVSYLESHAADQTLIESLSGIEEAFRQLDLLLEKNENLKQNLLETEQALARYEETIIIRKTEETRAAERLKRTEDEAGRAGKELAEITGSRDIAALREHADTIKDRENLLLSLLDQVSRIDEARKEEITHS
ncbi:MAG: AAA family ATPase, partial [Methanoregulaceae archaeon]